MKNEEQAKPIDLENLTGSISMFGYELIRDSLIPNLLGKETNEILYWAGKELARQYPVANYSDLVLFYKKACFGDLVLIKEKKHQKLFTLTGPTVTKRMEQHNPNFSLEAGFLAEQMQMLQELYAEALSEINLRTKTVTITLQWDAKEPVSIDQPLETVVLSEDYLSDEELEAEYQEFDLSKKIIDEPEFAEDEPEEIASFPDFQEFNKTQELDNEEISYPELDVKEVELEETSLPEETEELPLEEKELDDDEEEDIIVIESIPPFIEVEPAIFDDLTETLADETFSDLEHSDSVIVEPTIPTEHLTAEEALHEFDALSQVFSDINNEAAPIEEEELSIFDSLPSRSSRHNKKKK
ncbi:YslB family protein [Carnobacterium maltaromaticum]|uniref:YslB family protein n=1 Tax=Carnobacterium maltaromaticum TaxID=2751 RepID=UPI00295E3531|nr:YslB family protein [Carnobacterium maltaromaticum]